MTEIYHSISQIVDEINGPCLPEANPRAARYVIDAWQREYEFDDATIDVHLDALIDAGAKFDRIEATKIAWQLHGQSENTTT